MGKSKARRGNNFQKIMEQNQLDHIVAAAPLDIGVLLGDLAPHIQTAAAQAISQTQDQEGGGKPKVRVNLSVVIDLTKSPPAWHCEGSVGLRVKVIGEVRDEDDTPGLGLI